MAQQQGYIVKKNRVGCALLSLLTLFCVHLDHVECLCPADECRALLALKRTSESSSLSSWEDGSDCCDGWAGVACDTTATHVRALNLTGRLQLPRVIIPQEICQLRGLQVFNVSTKLEVWAGEGHIPDCLWAMAELRFLSISAASLTEITYLGSSETSNRGGSSIVVQGSLPAQVCNLEFLMHLDLGSIFQSSMVPDCLWHMTQLQYLALRANELSSEVCKLRHLTHLDVSVEYSISASESQIPSCIWRMTGLEFLGLIGFSKASPVSPEVCNIKNLALLDLTRSSLYGEIPSCIWSLKKLEYLSCEMSSSPLSISFSSDICSLNHLSYLSVRVDAAGGQIPACLWNMTHLKVLEIFQFSKPWLTGVPHQPPNLRGSLSSQLCNLSKLRRLALPYSDVTGVLPACIWNMTNLEFLDLSGLDLSTAEYPTEGCASSLKCLSLESTNLDTGLLDAVGSFPALSMLWLSGNSITSLAEGIRNISALESLTARSNLITRVPAWISNCSLLYDLDLSDNRISEFRINFGNMSSLETVDLSSNLLTDVSLSGPDSPIHGTTLSLSRNKIERISLTGFDYLTLYLDENSLSDVGTVLDLEDSSLSGLHLANNRISSFPAVALNLSTLSYLDLSDNPLEDISGLCDLRELNSLKLSNCSIGTLGEGVVPPCFKNFVRLSDINLSNNRVSGDLSALMSTSIPNLMQLASLDLSGNSLAGELASFSESEYQNLYRLDLSRNQLTGELPRLLLSRALSLNLSGNLLRGHFPEPYGENWDIDLSGNSFEGPLPSFSTSTFYSLVLSRNKFSGLFPSELGRSRHLYNLDLSCNEFSGEIPAFIGNFPRLGYLNLTSNSFTGSIPDTLGDCPELHHLLLKDNSLSGQIPSSLGTCTRLNILDLSHNNLEGTVPSALEKLSGSLQVFTAASNRLSGPFPAWIVGGNFTFLEVLDLSSNSFYGEPPAEYSKPSEFIHVGEELQQQ